LKFNIKPLSIKTKLTLFFAIFSLAILGIMWISQVLLLETTYNNKKKNDLIFLGEEITANLDSSDLNILINQKSFGNNNNIYLLNQNGMVLLPIEIASTSNNFLRSNLFNAMITNLNNVDDDVVIYKLKDESTSYVYCAKLIYNEETVYLYINSPLEPVKQTIALLSYQLLIITAIVILLSMVLAIIFSNNISKPVVQMSKAAKKLAKRDFNVVFVGSSYKEINELAETLNYTKSELMKSDDMQKQLIANVSHDLKTPLTMIKAYAEMIRDLNGDDKVKRKKNTNIIIDETDRLAALVNDILNISKAGTGLDNFEKKEENISEIVMGIIEKFGVLEEYKSYKFIIDVDTDLFSICNKEKMEQVIYNLIANAVNYTGDDKKITISLKEFKDYIRFVVIDTGKGIPKELLENIWDRYYRSVETHKRPIKGSGLGLSIVKSILNAHGFNFGVDSIVGSGSSFYIDFPKIID